MRERGERGGIGDFKKCISEKAFILLFSLYLHFMSRPRCNSPSNICIALVFECACARVCARVCVFIRGQAECLLFPDEG